MVLKNTGLSHALRRLMIILLMCISSALLYSQAIYAKTVHKTYSVKLSEFEESTYWNDGKHFRLGNSFEECEVNTGDTINYTLNIENDTDDDVFLPGIDADHYDKDGVFHDEDESDEEFVSIINSLKVKMNPSPTTDEGFKKIVFIGKGETLTINYSMTMRKAGAFASTLDYWSPCPDDIRGLVGRTTLPPNGGSGSGRTDYDAYYSYSVRAKWVGEPVGDDESLEDSSIKQESIGKNSKDNKESKKDDDDDDDDASYSDSSSSSGGWTPAPASAAPPKQTATEQLATAQSRISALSTIPVASKANFKKNGMALDLTSVNVLDKTTAGLIASNNDIPYNITFMFMGKPMICKIPAGFNYRRFIKADGTMNIHEVLWAIYSSQRR